MIKMSIAIILSMSLVACHNMPNSNDIISKSNNFTKKSFEDDELGWNYEGDWKYGNPLDDIGVNSYIYSNPEEPENGVSYPSGYKPAVIKDIKGGFVAENNLYDISTGNTKFGLWTSQNENSHNGSIIVNNGIPENISISPNIGEGNYGNLQGTYNGKNYNYNLGTPAILEDDFSSSNSNVLRSLTYHKGESLTSDLSQLKYYDWISKKKSSNNNDTYTYNFDKNKNTYITFEFIGTNIEISTMSGFQPGWNDINITLYSGNIVVSSDTYSMENNMNKTRSIKISGLKRGLYKVKIESKNPSSSTGKISNLFAFDKAIVYPSFQFELNKDESPFIHLEMLKHRNMGEAYIRIQDSNTLSVISEQLVDLYSNSEPNSNSMEKFIYKVEKAVLNKNNYLVTIESAGTKSNESLGYELNVYSYNKYPYISSTIIGKDVVLYFKKAPNFGKVDVYVDNIRLIKGFDLYSPLQSFEGLVLDNLSPVISNIHNVSIYPSYDLNNLSGLYSINVDAISTKSKATIKFLTSNSGNLRINTSSNDSMGMMKYSLYREIGDNSWQYLTGQTELDLFKPQITNLDTFEYNTKFFDLNVEANTKYKLEIEPMYTKHPNSKGYKIGIDNIRLSSDSSENSQSIADIICN